MTAKGGGSWPALLVLGGSLAAAAVSGLAVAIFVWVGDPLRFEAIDSTALVIRGALCLAWCGSFFSAFLWLRRQERRRAGLELLTMTLAPLGLLSFLVPLPRSVWLVPISVAVVGGLGALTLLAGFASRRALAATIGTERLASQLVLGRSPQLRAARGLLVVVGLAFCTLAAARPQLHQGTRMLSRRGIDVVVVLDFSKSMLARDVPPSRIDLAKREVSEFISLLGGDRIGLVAFAGEAVQFPMTTDYEAASLFFRDLDPYDLPVGGTAIGRALDAAIQLFQGDQRSRERSKVIVLLTDGEDHEGDPVAVARRAAEADIKVFVLGIGGRAPELVPRHLPDGTWSGFQQDNSGQYITTSLTEDNEAQLRRIAEVTSGRYFRAAPGQIGVEQITREIRRLRQQQLAERRVRLYGEAYQYFLVLGVIALVAGSVLPRGRQAGRGRGEP